MTLAINTPKGQLALEQERHSVRLFQYHTGLDWVETDKKLPGILDGMIVSDGVLSACVEVKARFDVDLEGFFTMYNNQWMISYEKIAALQLASKMFCCHGVGFLYIVQSETLLTIKISKQDGEPFEKGLKIHKVKTKDTINGGEKVDEVVYLDMSNAKMYRAEGIEREFLWPATEPAFQGQIHPKI